MSELMTSNLVKIIIGVLVAGIVIAGIAMFFGAKVISFFEGTSDFEGAGSGESQASSSGVSTPEPNVDCDDCGLWCRKKECEEEINEEWKNYYLERGIDLEEVEDRCEFENKLLGFGVCNKI